MKIILSILTILSLLTGCTPKEINQELTVVPTILDDAEANSAWCATFQLVWNDMKNEVVKQDIIFTPQLEMVENLNKESFKEDMLSDEYYYKTYGLKTLELKEQIEKGIKEKFNETSDILDMFDWREDALNDPNNPDVTRYFFYTMLKREFKFPKVFDILENDKFGEYENAKYFGIKKSSDKSLYDQVDVIYYKSKEDFAVRLMTLDGDEVILYKSPKGKTFEEMYKNLLQEAEDYRGNRSFTKNDELKIPYIKFDTIRTYEELAHKPFLAADGDKCQIEQAIQSIKFELDEKGGKIKSEAAIDMVKCTAIMPEPAPEQRYFYVDNTFAIFLKESDKDQPYFASKITDITKFQ